MVECFLSIHILVNRIVTMQDRHAEIVAADDTEMVVQCDLPIIPYVYSCS